MLKKSYGVKHLLTLLKKRLELAELTEDDMPVL